MASGCAHTVRQDKATGSDGKIKGAKPLILENGEVKASGIVTYPGGDRVDWRLVEVPPEQRGTMYVTLRWTPPRPGLQLKLDVFDEWNTPVAIAKRVTARSRRAKVENAKGKYFVRVYAARRGDAGKYKLTVEVKDDGNLAIDPSKLNIPDPPKLAAVPEPEIPCDETTFEVKNPACKTVCPTTGAPPGWPGCAGKCPTPPDAGIPACQATMPCPNPPDRRVKACKRFPKCDFENPDPGNPNCDQRPPVIARVLKNEIQGGEVVITIASGSSAGVQKDWHGVVLRGDTATPLAGGDITITRVDKGFTIGKVKLTIDQIKENPRVKLTAP
ncbi:MAG: hypothetical protein AB7P03_03825 [Kofleriaceae bacterium]